MPARADQLAFSFTEPRLPWLPAPEPVVAISRGVTATAAAPKNTAEFLALTGLRRMLPEGSVPLLYRKALSSRWEKLSLGGHRVEHAVVDLELWDGEPATVAVSAHVEGLRCMTKTGMFDKTGEEIELMATKPTTWWSMQWTRSPRGPFTWVEKRRRWERCVETA